jgi:phage terminase large subunit
MRQKGWNVVPAIKWAGSVEDGIDWLRGYDIIIHPNCKKIIEEFARYSYKTHRLTGDILPEIVDDWNHGIDSVRYALEPIIRAGRRIQTQRTTVKPIPTFNKYQK